MIGEGEGALYVAFMGTKQRRDLVANAQVIQDPVWPEDATALQDSASQVHSSVQPHFAQWFFVSTSLSGTECLT